MPELPHSIDGLLKLKSYSAGSQNIAIQFKWLHKSLYAFNCTIGSALANKCQNICNCILALVLHSVSSFFISCARRQLHQSRCVLALFSIIHYTDTNVVY